MPNVSPFASTVACRICAEVVTPARYPDRSTGIRPSRDPPGRVADPGVAARAGELTFERRERLDDLRGLERAVAPAHVDLPQDVGLDQARDRVIGGLEGAAHQAGC